MEDAQPKQEAAGMEPVASLLRRMEGKPGFPALSQSVAAINEITNGDDQNIDDLSNVILKDYGLTASVLRLANSALYRAASSGGITSVSRAVNVLGIATLREIALTVVLFDQMKGRPGARDIKEAFLRAQLAGILARETGRKFMPRQTEEVYSCALFHTLGQVLALLYFPEEAQQIKALIEQGRTEDQAALEVLGVGYSDFGQAVAAQWRFPAAMVSSLRPLPAGAVARPESAEDMLWVLSSFGNEVCASLIAGEGQAAGRNLAGLRDRFAGVMEISGPQLHSLVQKSADDAKVLAGTLGLHVGQSNLLKRVSNFLDAGPDDAATDRPARAESAAPAPTAAPAARTKAQRDEAQQVLASGISKLSASLVGEFKLNDVLRLTAETLLQALDFHRVLICMRDDSSGFMAARVGCGKDADHVVRKFRFALSGAPNVFQLAVANSLDILIEDIADAKIADKIPAWYRHTVSARTFTLMPLVIKERTVGLIYCDKLQPKSIRIAERESGMMNTLRNQTLLAIKQSLSG